MRTLKNHNLDCLNYFDLELVTVAIACRFVVLGNHRDAWTFGAVDPNSGTAALLEVTMTLFVGIVLLKMDQMA